MPNTDPFSTIDRMVLGFCGADHSHASIQSLELLCLSNEKKQTCLTQALQSGCIHELVILNTCNRVEFYFIAGSLDSGKAWITQFLSQEKKTDQTQIASLLTSLNTQDAIQHLFEVVSGVKSMVFGENEILTQVKNAYDNATHCNSTKSQLNKLFQSAIAVGKRVRSETDISRGACSVSSIAIDALRQTQLDYFAKSILVIGLGEMGQRCLKKLTALGHPNITIANRSKEKTNQIAQVHQLQTETYDTACQSAGDYDIVIVATATKDPIIQPETLDTSQPTLLIDLGLPRNIHPDCHHIDNQDIINVENLKEIAASNIGRRKGETIKVMEIINHETQRLNQWVTHKNNACAPILN